MTIQEFCKKVALTTIFGFLAITATAKGTAAQQPWQGDIDWAVGNGDAGGSVDCPDQYISNGVPYAIAVGGRSAVMNAALFAAYHQDFGQAYTLVLMTQCHNPSAQQELLNAGQKAVLQYLMENYTPTGIDPNQVIGLVQTALEALAAS
ncbi:MAG TPA: hypothetical protein VN902_05320 [Candidatus Acidoferrales bacterium]|jgi:hypothetical protein|nr:hypothetical protein [Candidatus Acidoferrales bacterium]